MQSDMRRARCRCACVNAYRRCGTDRTVAHLSMKTAQATNRPSAPSAAPLLHSHRLACAGEVPRPPRISKVSKTLLCYIARGAIMSSICILGLHFLLCPRSRKSSKWTSSHRPASRLKCYETPLSLYRLGSRRPKLASLSDLQKITTYRARYSLLPLKAFFGAHACKGLGK